MDSFCKKGFLLSVWFGAALVAACGPGVAEGPLPPPPSPDASRDADRADAPASRDSGTDGQRGADAGPAASDSGPAGPDSSAEPAWVPEDSCHDAAGEVTVVFSADRLGEDVRLVTMGASTILAEQTVDTIIEPVVVFLDAQGYEVGQARLAEPPEASVRAIGIANRRDAPLGETWPYAHEAMALLRGDSGNAFYGANRASEGVAELMPIEDSQLPSEPELRGLIYLAHKLAEGVPEQSLLHRICAFGDGVFCFSFDGSSWSRTDIVEPGTGALFNSLTILEIEDEWLMLAVGDQGRLVSATLGPEGDQGLWQELSSGTSENLLTITASGRQWAAAGEQGVVVHVDISTDARTLCNVTDQAIVSLKWWGDALRGVDRGGGLFGLPFGECEPCIYGVNLGSALYARLSGIDGDFLVLNSAALIRVHGIHEMVVVE